MSGNNTNTPNVETQNSTMTGLSQAELEGRVESLRKDDSELIQITDHIVKNGIAQIDKEGSLAYFKSAVPSFLVLLVSFIIDVSYVPMFGHVAASFSTWLFPNMPPVNQSLEPIQLWYFPVVVYAIFLFFAVRANTTLKHEVLTKGASEGIIVKVIEKYSGLIDSIGTALPLLGAALLLVSIKLGPQLFLGFSVPFEIKSIIILAIAKLFNSVFEAQGLRYQKIIEEVKNVETEYYYENRNKMQAELITKLSDSNRKVLAELVMNTGVGIKQFNKEEIEYIYKLIKMSNDVTKEFENSMVNFKNTLTEIQHIKLFDQNVSTELNAVSTTLTNIAGIVQKSSEYSTLLRQQLEAVHKLGQEVNNITIKLPDDKALKELQMTAHFLSETVSNMKDPAALKSLENLAYIAGKR